MTDEILRVIRQSELFTGLDPSLLHRIASAAERTNARAGEILFQQGDPADAVWGVLSGRVTETIRNEDGREMTVNVIEPGEVFGEVAVLDWGPRRYETVAVEDSALFRINRRQFLELLETSPELCFRVFALLCSHLRGASDALEDAALQKFPARLAKRLMILAANNGDTPGEEVANAGTAVLSVSQNELARLTGVNREAVNRHLRGWEKKGLLTLKRGQIEINDMAALASLTAPIDDSDGSGGKRLMFNAPEGLLGRRAGTSEAASQMQSQPTRGMRDVGLLAVVVSDYSRDMMADASRTLKSLKAGIMAIEKAVAGGGGTIIGQAGDSIIARFPDALAGLRAAKSIQSRIAPPTGATSEAKAQSPALFRLGVHAGDIVIDGDRHVGSAISIALRVAQYAEPGDVYLSGAVREQVKEESRTEFRFLGNQKFRSIEQSVPIYSAQPVPVWRWIWARADSLISRRLRPAAAIGAAVALMAVVWVTAQQFEGGGQPRSFARIPIAVLPFANAGDRENDYLAEGLSQEVRSALMTFPNLRITGEKSASYFRDKNASSAEIADILQVSYLLLGSIEQKDGEIRLSVQLFDAARASELWTRTYSEPERNLIEFRRDIAQSLASALDLSRGEGDGTPYVAAAARDPRAYSLYLQAKFLSNQGMQKTTLSALPLLHEAVEVEPGFAEAWALLAKLYRGINRPPHTAGYGQDELDRLSEAALAKALEYGPDSPKVVVTAAILTRNLETRDRLTARAVALYPDDPDALMAMAGTYAREDNFVGQLETMERVLVLDPLNRRAMNRYAQVLLRVNRLQETRAVLGRIKMLHPHSVPPHAMLAEVSLRQRDYVRAVAVAREGRPYGDFPDLWFELKDFDWNIRPRLRAAGPHAFVGDYGAAREILAEAFQDRPDHLEHLIAGGTLASLEGDYAGAIALFERAIPLLPEGEPSLFWSNSFSPWLDWARKSCPGAALLHAYRRAGENQKGDRLGAILAGKMEHMRAGYAAAGAPAEHIFLYVEAEIHAIEGRSAEALATLRTWRKYDPHLFSYVRRDPFLESLHSEPGFWKIVAEVEADLAEIRKQIKAARSE